MRWMFIAVLAASGCFTRPDPPVGVDGAVIIGGARRTLTITQPPGVPLMHFPLAVVLTDYHLGMHATAIQHIAFTTLAGVALPCEIVRYAPTVGQLEAWVELPELSAANNQLLLVYGPDVQTTCAPMWTGYRAAWHLDDALMGTSRDSTGNGHTLMSGAVGLTSDYPPGRAGGALYFHNGTEGPDQICTPTGGLAAGLTSLTFELWVNPVQLITEYDVYMTKGGRAADPGYDIELGQTDWLAWVRDKNLVDASAAFTNDGQSLAGTWTHLAAVIDREEGVMRAYRNGALTSAPVALPPASFDSTRPFCLGSDQPIDGVMDEPRIIDGARPGEWFAAEYANLAMPLFLLIDPPPI